MHVFLEFKLKVETEMQEPVAGSCCPVVGWWEWLEWPGWFWSGDDPIVCHVLKWGEKGGTTPLLSGRHFEKQPLLVGVSHICLQYAGDLGAHVDTPENPLSCSEPARG